MPPQHRHGAVWSTQMKIRLMSRLRNLIDRVQRICNGGNKKLGISTQNLENVLVQLPVELLLLIADHLTPSEKALFSLSSKRLRMILTGYFDLCLRDKDEKVDFLLLLERDLPDHLTCRLCASLFQWRLRLPSQHLRCPNVGRGEHWREYYYCLFEKCGERHAAMTQELFDLISRARLRGPRHGLPVSHINHSCFSTHVLTGLRLYEHLEGRIIDDELILAISRTFALPNTEPRGDFWWLLEIPICYHQSFKVIENNNPIAQATREPHRLSLTSETAKCQDCATDFRSTFYPCRRDGVLRGELHVWHNYGRCRVGQRTPTIAFDKVRHKLDDATIAARNLEAVFTNDRDRCGNHDLSKVDGVAELRTLGQVVSITS